ncbi:dihydrodipicolinate reductase [Mycobacterium sp. WUMAC-067]|uniref:NAD(P)H-dependent amine dehydrogenase family protein n=1 Tax=unclassified Mycobacterium TaxID=2642494 RepID=UPI001CD9665E|nr:MULTISPECIES: dihydrodipicolinate reductase [unclassified Mycobacterium]MCA2244790.1 dihydrodipicolinate reductase [Mycobacterium sp. WUMAC-067]MCA2316000.1 dihydrodipicolinate reductase [Mycobacterium sp. WUMAC-025]
MTVTRVAQWATGTTGSKALGAVIDAPGLELVGVRVYDPAKVGVDAGVLAGRAPTGVRATNDTAALLAARPDVVLYMGQVEKSPDDCFADVAAVLNAGVNVITTGSSFIDVAAFDPARGALIADACRRGKSSFLGLGLFPGFWGEVVAPVLARLSAQCTGITVRESLSYAGYPSRQMLVDVMGYGQPPDSRSPLLGDPNRAGAAFIGTVTVLAKALGLTPTSVEAFRETAVTNTDLHVAAGPIAAGTVAAMKLGVRADCGPMTIAVEHVTWLDDAVAPNWSSAQGYELEFVGTPAMRCQLVLGGDGQDHTDMGCLATARHAVSAIPFITAAPPGVVDLADMASLTGGH